MNNYEQMREAFKKIDDEMSFCDRNVELGIGFALEGLREHCRIVREILKSALAAPPRQCDIGTVEEQDDRWESFCASHHSSWKIIGGTGTMICDCPCYKGNNKCNRFAWAQMPYAAKEGVEQ